MRRLALLLLAGPLLAAEPYDGRAGAFEVAVEKTIRLERDGAPLLVRATYPKSGTKLPLLVWSHGMFGSKDAYDPLVRFWASHGYVVFQPTHPDSLALGRKTQAEALRAWNRRPRETKLLLDSLAAVEKAVPALAGRLDATRVGAGGHSFGAHTSMLIGGVTARTLRGHESFRDPRIRCVFLVSPQGRGSLLTKESYASLAVPAFVVTGSNDRDRSGRPPETRLDPFRLAPRKEKFLLWIDGAHHGFGGITGKRRWSGGGPKNAGQVKLVQRAGLAFFDAHVRGRDVARRFLASDALAVDGVRFEKR